MKNVYDNEKNKFFDTAEGPAVRVSEFGGSFLSGVDFDEIAIAYPTSTTETYTYKLATVTQITLTVTYTDPSKNNLSSVVKS